jgi:hypothetical protein
MGEVVAILDEDREFERLKDPLYWRFKGDYCFSSEPGTPRRHLPLGRDTYNWLFFERMAGRYTRHMVLPKSRQMQATWNICAYLIHQAMFVPNSEVLVINKKDDDSAYLVSRGDTRGGDFAKGQGRCWTLYDNQPEWVKRRMPATCARNQINLANGSMILGLPEGDRQLQQYQKALVYFDECAWMEQYMNRLMRGALPMASYVLSSSTSQGMNDFYHVTMDIPPENESLEEAA